MIDLQCLHNHPTEVFECITKLEAENRELKAQVEQLRQAISTVRLAGKVGGFVQQSLAGAKAERLAWMKLNEVCQLTPAQCLAEIKAQAGRDGFIAGLFSEIHSPTTVWNREERADKYANLLRQQAKDGE